MHPSPKTILLLLLCGLGGFVKAQTVWNKRYVDTRPAMQYASVITRDSLFYTVGVSVPISPPFIPKVMWSRFNQDGVLQNYIVYKDTDRVEYGAFLNTLIAENDSIVKLFGYVADTVNIYPILWSIKPDGTLKRTTVFPDSTTDFVRGDYMTKDNSNNYYLGCNFQYLNGNVDACVIKVNSEDSVLWKRKYGVGSPWWEFPTSLALLNNDNVMIGSFKYDLNLPNMKSYTWLFEIDSEGMILRQWYDHDSTMEAKALKQTSDGGFIYTSKRIITQDIIDVTVRATVVKMDSSLSVEWKWEHPQTMGSGVGGTDIEELPNGDFLVCGKGNLVMPNHNLAGAFIMKLGSDGSEKWKQVYTALDTNGVDSYLNDIDVLPDGSYVAVGYVNIPQSITQTQGQQAWMLKIDSNGCEIENCLTAIDDRQQTQDTRQIQVYPNPATSSFFLDIENPLLQGGSLDLYNIDGKKLSSTANNFTRQTKVDISQFPNGIYLWRYTAPNQEVQSGKVVKE